MDRLYIVMPAYNEEANIEAVVRDWYPLLEGKDARSRLVVADSGSTDGTRAVLERLRKELPKLEILPDTLRQHGPKVIALYDHAVREGADWIFQTDSDGQTDPAAFPAFWERRERYAAVFGRRDQREDGPMRAFVERVVCLLLRIFFGVRVPDANAPFRLMRADRVKEYVYRLPADYDLPNIMMTTYFAYYKEKILFRAVPFRPRQGGENSVDLARIVKTGWKALGDFRRLKSEMGPQDRT